jgi:hypothetical protein
MWDWQRERRPSPGSAQRLSRILEVQERIDAEFRAIPDPRHNEQPGDRTTEQWMDERNQRRREQRNMSKKNEKQKSKQNPVDAEAEHYATNLRALNTHLGREVARDDFQAEHSPISSIRFRDSVGRLETLHATDKTHVISEVQKAAGWVIRLKRRSDGATSYTPMHNVRDWEEAT